MLKPRRRHAAFAIVLALFMVLPPQAFARMGHGSSFGSRGARTYDRPMERSYTPRPAPSYSPYRAPMAATAPYGAGGPFRRSPFLGAVLGGLTGFGLGGLLFGNSAYGAWGMSPVGGLIGLAIQLALIFFVVRWVLRMLRGFGVEKRAMNPSAFHAATAPRVAKEFEPGEADKQAFGVILVAIQRAWSAGDLPQIRRLATPEMVSMLAEDLAANASRGERNVVDDVRLLKGEVVEAWREDGRDYATATLTFSALDYTLRDGTDVVVAGDRHRPTQSSEAWTFTRVPGGQWLLSAVER